MKVNIETGKRGKNWLKKQGKCLTVVSIFNWKEQKNLITCGNQDDVTVKKKNSITENVV